MNVRAATAMVREAWSAVRRATGDDAYERYLVHRRERHADDGGAPLSAAEFYRREIDRKWGGVRRCC
ncbi:MAG: CstA-like transporter-associated (seleno)protein [Gammaproteobacteria bacterium]